MTAQEAAFFAGGEDAWSLWLCLREKLSRELDTFEVRVAKIQLSLVSGCLFACVSFPRARQGGVLLLSFGLPFRVESPRVWQAVEPYPNRWTHHVPLSEARDLDEELIGWLAAAQRFAMSKRGPRREKEKTRPSAKG